LADNPNQVSTNPEFAGMLGELEGMPGVDYVDFVISDRHLIDITLAETTNELRLKDLFTCVQWGISYRSGDREIWERRVPLRDLPDTILRIYSTNGEIIYSFLGSCIDPYGREYDPWNYYWYANVWPDMETAFSFLFPQDEHYNNNADNAAVKEKPLSINGVHIFNEDEDLAFLKPGILGLFTQRALCVSNL
jgi:hypothetical protein